MRLSAPLERVLRALLEDPSEPRYGYDLMKAAHLASGTLYPMLARLQRDGLLVSEWEQPRTGDQDGRPPRKYYRLTGEGIRVARLELAAADLNAPRTAGGSSAGRPAPGGAW